MSTIHCYRPSFRYVTFHFRKLFRLLFMPRNQKVSCSVLRCDTGGSMVSRYFSLERSGFVEHDTYDYNKLLLKLLNCFLRNACMHHSAGKSSNPMALFRLNGLMAEMISFVSRHFNSEEAQLTRTFYRCNKQHVIEDEEASINVHNCAIVRLSYLITIGLRPSVPLASAISSLFSWHAMRSTFLDLLRNRSSSVSHSLLLVVKIRAFSSLRALVRFQVSATN